MSVGGVGRRSPADCFATIYEAVRLAVAHMTPVLVLSDGMTAVEAEPWRIPRSQSTAAHPGSTTGDG